MVIDGCGAQWHQVLDWAGEDIEQYGRRPRQQTASGLRAHLLLCVPEKIARKSHELLSCGGAAGIVRRGLLACFETVGCYGAGRLLRTIFTSL